MDWPSLCWWWRRCLLGLPVWWCTLHPNNESKPRRQHLIGVFTGPLPQKKTRGRVQTHLLHDIRQFAESFLRKTLEGGNAADTDRNDSNSKVGVCCEKIINTRWMEPCGVCLSDQRTNNATLSNHCGGTVSICDIYKKHRLLIFSWASDRSADSNKPLQKYLKSVKQKSRRQRRREYDHVMRLFLFLTDVIVYIYIITFILFIMWILLQPELFW